MRNSSTKPRSANKTFFSDLILKATEHSKKLTVIDTLIYCVLMVALIILMVLMIIGGSSGSTSGGLKLIRAITILKGMNLTVTNLVSPEGRVVSTRIGGKKINEREIKEASAYIAIFFIFLMFGWVVMTLYGYDPFTALFDVISIQSNNGLSTGIVFGGLPIPVKLTLIFLMWIGRLEIIPVLVVFRTIVGLITPRK